jgi:tetratricopeptide (TPR) repeat protein
LAAGLLGKGELREAERVSMEGLDIAEQLGENRVAIWLESQLARVLAELGDDGARKFAEQGVARSQTLGQIVLRAWALQGLGFVYWRRGEFERAAETYQQGLHVLQESENRVARNSLAPYAAQAFFNSGRTEQAAALAYHALELAESGRTPQAAALAQDVLGQIWCGQENWNDAQRALDASIATFEKLGSRLDLARALEHRAALSRTRNDMERATNDETRARALYMETGAKK